MTVGFVGLGIMGSRMAARLRAAGNELVVANRTRSKAESLIAAGAQWADRPADVGKKSDILFTMLADPAAVQAAAGGVDGFLAQLKPGAIWVDCSTTNPAFARRMAEQANAFGIHFLDAPVMGSKDAAASGQLVFLVGGEPTDVDTCRPYFSVLGREARHLGSVGAGISLKLVNNYLFGQAVLAFAEALVFGESMGLDRQTLLDTLLGSPVVPAYMSAKRRNFETGEFEAAFPLKWMRMDLEMASQTAYELGAAMPSGNVAKEIYALASQHGLADADYSAIYKFLSEKSS
jgi:3-hydroxyisobutyrate dehydrogenase/glyoxylate/succinic semialdehyde reductase